MASSRRKQVPVESSWRMVEGGENDSFDTSIAADYDEEVIISSGSDPSQLSQLTQMSNLSQLSGSQPFSIGGSQDDNIENFLIKAEKGEQVIGRTPFQPSVPQSVRESSRETMRHRSPETEFIMPTLEHESPRRSTRSSSSRTVRPAPPLPPMIPGLRKRQRESAERARTPRIKSESSDYEESPPKSFSDRVSESLPSALYDMLGWFFGLIGLTFRYAQRPLAIALACYVTFAALFMAQNAAKQSVLTALSPICHIPGATFLNLPFCLDMFPKDGQDDKPVEFDELMKVQGQFEQVLEKAAQGVSYPLEMKRSEIAARDLRTLVRHSALQGKDELLLEFDGFLDAVRKGSNELTKFNAHVGSAVDSLISINRWTSRYLDTLSAEHEQDVSAAASPGLGAFLATCARWAFAPFRVDVRFSERHLLDKYVEHTALVSDRIANLIVEAQVVLGTLSRAEDHLGVMHEFVARTQSSVANRRADVLWTLWTLVGANTRRLQGFDEQLRLLARVDGQRQDAVEQVSGLVVELEKIQAGLGDLRERVGEPGLVSGRVRIPLSVHIETIDRGVERLAAARDRLRTVEEDRIREVLGKGKGEERLLDAA